MFKIGNIITKSNLVNHTKVEYINYIQWSDGIDYDQSIPTLIVGWNFFKSLYPINSETILNKEVEENILYWEFSFDEKKEDHVTGVDLFTRNVPYYFFRKNFKYINLDPIFNKIESINDLIVKAPQTSKSVYNYKNQMLYILFTDTIYGIDLNMYSYFNIDIEAITNHFKQVTTNYFFDEDGSYHQKYYKIYPNFEELKRYLVILLSKA